MMKIEQTESKNYSTEKKNNFKRKGKVILVTPTYIVYNDNGNSKCLYGKFNVKIGDEIEI